MASVTDELAASLETKVRSWLARKDRIRAIGECRVQLDCDFDAAHTIVRLIERSPHTSEEIRDSIQRAATDQRTPSRSPSPDAEHTSHASGEGRNSSAAHRSSEGCGESLAIGTLSQDLIRYSHELYTKRDLESGLKIVKEVAGLITVGGFAISALTIWLPAIGITLSSYAIARIVVQVARAYHDLSEEERKQIRAALSWIKGGFTLGDRLLD